MFEEPLSHERLDRILAELHQELKKTLGDRLNSVFLYGSQARGDARPDSDIDVLIVINGDFDYSQIQEITSAPAWKLSFDNDVVISRVFISKEKFDSADTPFLANVHREALQI